MVGLILVCQHPRSALCCRAGAEMDPDVAVSLAIGIVGVVLSAFALFQTQRAKAAGYRARLIDRAASRLEAFEGVSGSEDMARIPEYKMKQIREPGRYHAHFRQNSPLDIEVARSRLAKFRKVTIHLYEKKAALSDGVLDRGQWLRWGDRYRQLVELLDVARYYRDGFFAENHVEYHEADNLQK